ncbi:MAG: FAD-linked oxidase C-terminal domain-containing protein [Anaerolineae bacterium]|nr:FAD-linked oxidase C-terminal domain-containing protein [Anaerolineae bacterium]
MKKILEPGQVVDDPVELVTYEADGGVDRGAPVGVVFPYTTSDVQKVMRWTQGHDMPVAVRGAGTGLAGGAIPLDNALALSFSNMKKLIDLDIDARSAVVEPGMINLNLDNIAQADGLYFPPDPASGRAATIGGNIAANAGGPHCFKYGVTTNYVTGVECVLADGNVMQFGGRALDYPEYDFTGLMTGSEGTLGMVTQASVRLLRNPPAVSTLLASFESVAQAGEAVSAMIAEGLVPATMEMMGQRMMRLVEEYNHPGLPVDAGAVIIIDVDGYPESMLPQLEEVTQVLRANQAGEIRVATSEEERAKIWLARKSAAGALARVSLDHYTVDGTVPRSLLAETLREIIKICEDLELPVVFLLHAGDGNLHPMVLVTDHDDTEFFERLHEGGRRMSEVFLAAGGTITGEHGVGFEKREFMSMMYTTDELAAMREIKDIFDPAGRLNPGKIFPTRAKGRISSLPSDDINFTSLAEHTGSTPAWFFAEDEAHTSEILRYCAFHNLAVHITGAVEGSSGLPDVDVILSTSKMAGVKKYALDDLYVTVGAGTLVRDVEAELAGDAMWIPMQAPWDDATIGGMVSGNINAPLRMLYGGLRDIVQAMTVVLPDGRIVRYGRPVMKNVAGYDMIKLFIGAHGSLGVITEVTFKLRPAPRTRRTLIVPVDDIATGMVYGQRLFRQSLVASAVLLSRNIKLPPFVEENAIIYTVEGLVDDVHAEIVQAGEILPAGEIEKSVQCDPSGSDIWAEWIRNLVIAGDQEDKEEILIKIGFPPKNLPMLLQDGLEGLVADCSSMVDFANGHIYCYGKFDMDEIRTRIADFEGYAVILAEGSSDRWGYQPSSLRLMQEVKRRWDPSGILNPGEFLV